MYRRRLRRGNDCGRALLLCLAGLAACDGPAPEAPPTRAEAGRSVANLHLGPTERPARFGAPEVAALTVASPTVRVSRLVEPSPAARLAAPLSGRLDPARGAALVAALEALPPDRRALGLSGLTIEALDGELCEAPHVLFETEAEGRTYEHRYEIPPRLWMSDLRLATYALPDACVQALLAAGGDVPSTFDRGCARDDVAAHLPPGSSCRACVDEDGDHARCVAEGACPAEAGRQVTGNGNVRYDVAEATTLACAPDLTQKVVFLLRRGDAPSLPGLFEHGRIAFLCSAHWAADIGAPDLFCNQNRGVGIGLADVLAARVQHIRPAGDPRPLYEHRLALTAMPVVDGATYDFMPVFPGQLAELSVPIPRGGWGLDPRALRPGGADPADPFDTFAADWLAAVAVKTATRTDQVPIGVYNRNVCRDQDWEGPDAHGRYHCATPVEYFDAPPDDIGTWMFDWTIFPSADGRRVDILPLVTLGATGAMDASIPGGFVPRVLGTPSLADPEWEACAWPETFMPDEITSGDNATVPAYTYTGQTWRFGAHPGLDLRVVLSTNWRRGFCFEALPPGTR